MRLSYFYIFAAFLASLFLSSQPVFATCGFYNVTGYAWSGNTGWISLNCRSGGSVDYGLNIDFETESDEIPVTGYAWSSGLGWLDFQPSSGYPVVAGVRQSGATFVRSEGGEFGTTGGTIEGWAKWVSLGENGWMQLGPIDITGTDYGIQVGDDRLFSGWSWNGGDDIDTDETYDRGDGWVKWESEDGQNGTGGGASVAAYWFETLYGDIYGGSLVSEPFSPPSDRYNATYIIQSNGSITPVVIKSALGAEAPYVDATRELFALPTVSNKYRGTLGWLDKAGMVSGRYGEVVSALPASPIVLGGSVYHYTATTTIASALVFNRGDAATSGAGTVVVDGDLNINANMTYQTDVASGNIKSLPSVAWIVDGNIIIDPSVTELNGVFFATGTISTGTTGASASDVQLIIRGMLIAKNIHLERIYLNIPEDEEEPIGDDPAEQIYFDGRAIVNPPPGLGDIANGLPVLRETRQ